MPLTPELRRSIDRIRDHLFGGGYPNPSQNAEQLSFLFYFCMFETADAAHVRAARRPGAEPYHSPFEEDWKLRNPRNALTPGAAAVPGDSLRWSRWAKAMTGERLVSWVREEVFPFYAEVAAEGATDFMEGARLVIDEPAVLAQVVAQVDALHLEEVDADTKGDLFEHVLRQIRQAGELGQFRTPRHVIRALVRLVDPRFGETVCDPAAGTGGFLVGAWDHIRLSNSTSAGIEELEADGKAVRRGIGDRLAQADMARLRRETLFGMDVDPQMVRLATMNLTLRGLEDVPVHRRDALTRTLDRAEKASLGLPPEGFDVMLANPPFSGRVDRDRVVEDVKVGRTGQTELLFLQYMLNHLKPGGRCGVVVPEGVLFGSTGAHKELRRKLIETNRVEAVLSLPGGVFNPYSGVKTSLLLFRKGGATERVMFLHADNDGYKLDANHDTPIDEDDLPALTEAFEDREARLEAWAARDPEENWTENWWFAETEAIREADWNLSASRHRPLNHSTEEHRDPLELLEELRGIELSILNDIDQLAKTMRERESDSPNTPIAWDIARLGEVCTIIGGGTPRRTNTAYFGGSIPWATPTDVTALNGLLIQRTAETITETGLRESSARLMPARTVLLTSRATIGYTAIAAVPMATNQGFANLICGDRLLPEYLAVWLRLQKDRLIQLAGGTTFKEISKSTLKKIEIPVPPLEKQREVADLVVRALDTAVKAQTAANAATVVSASLAISLIEGAN